MSKGRRLSYARNVLLQVRRLLAPGRLHDAEWRAECTRVMSNVNAFFCDGEASTDATPQERSAK